MFSKLFNSPRFLTAAGMLSLMSAASNPLAAIQETAAPLPFVCSQSAATANTRHAIIDYDEKGQLQMTFYNARGGLDYKTKGLYKTPRLIAWADEYCAGRLNMPIAEESGDTSHYNCVGRNYQTASLEMVDMRTTAFTRNAKMEMRSDLPFHILRTQALSYCMNN